MLDCKEYPDFFSISAIIVSLTCQSISEDSLERLLYMVQEVFQVPLVSLDSLFRLTSARRPFFGIGFALLPYLLKTDGGNAGIAGRACLPASYGSHVTG